MNRLVKLLLLPGVLLAGCAAPRPTPVPEPAADTVPVPEPVPPFPHSFVWTPRAEFPIRTENGTLAVPYLFTRLEVLGPDSLGLRVRCSFCPGEVNGWVGRDEVLYQPSTPHLAAPGELGEFLLALRAAALQLDFELLRPVMARNFVHAYDSAEGPDEAFNRWRWQRFGALDHLPRLLDHGVASRDGRIWVAPPEFVTDPGYGGLRAGFRRAGDRWEWLFLVGGS